MNNFSPIIVALDFNSDKKALAFVEKVNPQQCCLKIGQDIFLRYGMAFVKHVQDEGFAVFLDLKFNDIPKVVARSMAIIADAGVWMTNVNAFGGVEMMEAAKTALLPYGKDAPSLIAVTVLTSMRRDDLIHLGIDLPVEEQSERLALLAKHSGLDGVICSAREAQRFRLRLGKEFKLVTPGIRPVGSGSDDQKRIMTPQRAKVTGVDYLIIGRPITQAEDPQKVISDILLSMD